MRKSRFIEAQIIGMPNRIWLADQPRSDRRGLALSCGSQGYGHDGDRRQVHVGSAQEQHVH